MTSDEQLVQEMGRGQQGALVELIHRYQQHTLQLAFRSLGDWHLAEDVVQEAFMRVHRAAPKYRPEAKFSTWFYRIVTNLCMDKLRRFKRLARGSVDIRTEFASSADNPAHIQEVLEVQQAVQGALDHLNERERMAVIFHRFEGFSHEQIAEMMQTSVPAVESLLVRAYRKLRQHLATFSKKSLE